MADIKQAVRWMLEGKTVSCTGWKAKILPGDHQIVHAGSDDLFEIYVSDILSERWEIVEDKQSSIAR